MADSNKSKRFSFRKKKGKGSKSSTLKKGTANGMGTILPPPTPLVCQAVRDFDAIEPCDLSFRAGDKITVTTRTEKQFDWWEGRLRGKVGIFPANYVQVVKP